MTEPKSRLLIVYNADGGVLNALKDAFWKVTSPDTYPCSLCALTYGAVSMHGDWRRFLQSLPLEIVFHHRDDFAEDYPDADIALPAILVSGEGEPPRELVPAHELDTMADRGELIKRVEERLISEHFRSPSLRIVA